MLDLSKCVVMNIGMHTTRGVICLDKRLYPLVNVPGKPMYTSVVVKDGRLVSCYDTSMQSFGSYVCGFTRLLGKKFKDYTNLGLDDSVFGCRVVNQNDTPVFDLQGVLVSPVAATSEVIKCVMDVAKRRVKTVDTVILIIPDGYDCFQKEALIEAVVSAGYKCPFLLPESFAAVMDSIDVSQLTPQVFLVYDFGGESFKTALIRYENGVLQRLKYQQLASLSGSLFDEMLREKVLAEFPEVIPKGPSKETSTLTKRLLSICRQSKEISCKDDGVITIDLDDMDLDETVTLEYEDVKSMFESEMKKTLTAVEEIIRSQYHILDTHSITKVVMVGGMSMFPVVKETIQNRFSGRVESKNELCRIVEGGYSYLRMTETENPCVQLALGRKIGIAVTRNTVHSLFYEDYMPPRKVCFIIELRNPRDTMLKTAIYEIRGLHGGREYKINECTLIRLLTYSLERRSETNRYMLSFQLKDINTMVFECKDAKTEKTLIPSQELVFWLVC